MGIVNLFHCYNYSREWYLVEMALDIPPSEIEWDKLVVPEDGVEERDWQCAYMEQYLNDDGTEKICDTYNEPENDEKPCRVVFFIYKEGGNLLRTPYGDFPLTTSERVPKRLKNIIEFESD